MIATLAERVNADAALVRRGRFVATSFLLEVGAEAWLIRVEHGRIVEVTKGPFVMPSWTFALRAPADAWARFWAPAPEPGFHDLFALIKQRLLRVEGDLHPFMANLFYFKGVLGSLRGGAPA
jgi:hypothetical protein